MRSLTLRMQWPSVGSASTFQQVDFPKLNEVPNGTMILAGCGNTNPEQHVNSIYINLLIRTSFKNNL
jgi:hypothetical protein